MISKKIGVDLHGVIDDDITFFKGLLEIFYFASIEIYVISGPPVKDIEQELEEYGFKKGLHYQHVASVVDHLKNKGVQMWIGQEGTWWASDDEWWSAKAEICDNKNIDLMIDDSEEYEKAFKKIRTKFLLYTS